MSFTLDEKFHAVAKIKVIGVGGAGGNAVNRMIEEELSGVEFITINTDAMALENNKAGIRVQIGERITKGLGAGANPEIGKIAMEEDRERVEEILTGSDMVFITAGMGGGTGTGGAPIVAEIARELDILTVAIVTRPFLFEGKIRDRNAKRGIDELRKYVDTIIVIPNQKLLSIVDRNTSLISAFKTADHVLHNATKGISDLITVTGLVNLDFADVRTIMKGMGDAIMGTGYGEGENRAILAAEAAIHSPMLDDISIIGAKGILINISGGDDLTLHDVGDATQTIYDAVGEDNETNIIFGAVTNSTLNGKLQVTVIATGFNEDTLISDSRKGKTGAALNQSKTIMDNKGEQMKVNLEEKQKEQPFSKQAAEAASMKLHTIPFQKKDLEEPGKSITDSEFYTKSRDVQVIVKATPVSKEQIFPSKTQATLHYEDDMDVPTFLRKQMQ